MNDSDDSVREILEGITKDALSSLGYETRPNELRENRDNEGVESDVWAEKDDSDIQVYVSCKNWEDGIGRGLIDQESGRVNSFLEIPHIKIIVASEFNGQAKSNAHAHGFQTIEIGQKANSENSDEIRNISNGS